jgi:hypothetical protein
MVRARIILVATLVLIVAGCSRVERLLPQDQANTIDLYVIDLNDFPAEKERVLQESNESAKRFLEELMRYQIGSQIKDFRIQIVGEFYPHPTKAKRRPSIHPMETFPFVPKDVSNALDQEILAKVKKNREKYLVARINAGSIYLAELCPMFKEARSKLPPWTLYYYIDTHDNTALLQRVEELLKGCQAL